MANIEYDKLSENGLRPVILCSDNGNGTFTGIGAVDAQGAASMPTKPSVSQDDIARGLVTGATQTVKFALKENATSGAGEETIWASAGNFTVMTTASMLDVTYDETTDGAGTTGALTLLITYLDANFEEQTAVHTLGSTGDDTTAFSVLGVNRALVFSSGAADMNTSSITLTAPDGIQAFIPATASVTQQLILHIPINTIGIIKYLHVTGNKVSGQDATIDYRLYSYSRFTETRYLIWDDVVDTSVSTHVNLVDPLGLPVSGRDVVYMTMDTTRTGTQVSARMSINLYAT